MKFAAAILAKFSRRTAEQPDAFDQRLQSMGAEKTRKAHRAVPALFVRAAHA